MILRKTVEGIFATNAYFYFDENTRHGILIDPGFEAGTLLAVIRERGLFIEKILITHGHFDHFAVAEELQQALSCPIVMGERSREYVGSPYLNLSANYRPLTLSDVTYVPDGTAVPLETNPAMCLTLVSVPGHTPDSMMFLPSDTPAAFVGDSIFRNSFGLTHFPGGDERMLFESCMQRILALPDETRLLSGHSEPTTVGEEKERPWFRHVA